MKLPLIGVVALAGTCLVACADEPPPVYYAPSPPPLPRPVYGPVRIHAPPPPLPVYDQPPLPGPGYIWTPGYWAWSASAGDYFWVPGAWVLAPEPGLLWTPAWWGWSGDVYVFHGGYWGPHVGFYGGIAYGFGYTGVGYQGGYWQRGSFFYNRAVNHVTNVGNVTNVYNQTIVNRVNVNVTRVSYNGGPGGIAAAPTLQERAVAAERRVPPTPVQAQARSTAAHAPQAFANVNRGRPPAPVLAGRPSAAQPFTAPNGNALARLPQYQRQPFAASQGQAPAYPQARSSQPTSGTFTRPQPQAALNVGNFPSAQQPRSAGAPLSFSRSPGPRAYPSQYAQTRPNPGRPPPRPHPPSAPHRSPPRQSPKQER